MATVRDVIRRSMSLIGAIAVGESPTDEEAADGLQTLNDMLDSWVIERLLLYTIERRVVTLTSGLQNHTVGVGGVLNFARPPRIARAGIIVSGAETPIDILDADMWSQIPTKSTSGIPTSVWDDGAFPLRNLNIYPIPSQAYQMALYNWNAIGQFSTVNDVISFPPGYGRAVRYCLAVEMAGEYDKEVPAAVLAVAVQAKAAVKSFNTPTPVMGVDTALAGARPFNVATG